MRSQSHERLWPPQLKLKFGNGWFTSNCCGSSCKKFNSSFQFQFQFQFQGFQFQFHFQFHQFQFQFQFQFRNWNWNWAAIPIPELNWPQPWTWLWLYFSLFLSRSLKYLIISWYLHVRNGVAVAAYSRLASRSHVKFHTKKLSPLVRPCTAAPAQSTTSAYRSLDFRRATSSPRGRWVGSWPLLLRSVHEDTS